MRALWIVMIVSLHLGACGTLVPAPDRELFDEATGNTVTAVSKPIVFARERTDLAAHSRDYVTLVTLEVDHSGTSKHYFLLYRWSTVDTRMAALPGADAGQLRLVSEGRALTFDPMETLPVGSAAIAQLQAPLHTDIVVRSYAVDVDTLRFIAASRVLSLQLPKEVLSSPFVLWNDGRPALSKFVHQILVP